LAVYFSWSEKMNSKVFSQRFNRELASLCFPEELMEKTRAVARVFGVSRYHANSMIYGHMLPDEEVLEKIAAILEVCPQWLAGATDKRSGTATDKRKASANRETEREAVEG
jgi:hypothetical protein